MKKKGDDLASPTPPPHPLPHPTPASSLQGILQKGSNWTLTLPSSGRADQDNLEPESSLSRTHSSCQRLTAFAYINEIQTCVWRNSSPRVKLLTLLLGCKSLLWWSGKLFTCLEFIFQWTLYYSNVFRRHWLTVWSQPHLLTLWAPTELSSWNLLERNLDPFRRATCA